MNLKKTSWTPRPKGEIWRLLEPQSATCLHMKYLSLPKVCVRISCPPIKPRLWAPSLFILIHSLQARVALRWHLDAPDGSRESKVPMSGAPSRWRTPCSRLRHRRLWTEGCRHCRPPLRGELPHGIRRNLQSMWAMNAYKWGLPIKYSVWWIKYSVWRKTWEFGPT